MGHISHPRKQVIKTWKQFNMFSLFHTYLALEKGVVLSINLNSYHPSMICTKFGSNWPSDSWEEDENVKRLQTDRQTASVDQKSSLELKKTYLYCNYLLLKSFQRLQEFSIFS